MRNHGGVCWEDMGRMIGIRQEGAVTALCAINQLAVLSTWFRMKSIHYGAWRYPATKVSHMINCDDADGSTVEMFVL